MSNSIDNLMIEPPPIYTQSEEYRSFVERTLPILRHSSKNIQLSFTKEQLYLYKGDLTKLLVDAGIPVEDHYLVARLNGIRSMFFELDQFDTLTIPDPSMLQQIKGRFAISK